MNNRANHQSGQTHTHHRSRKPKIPTSPTSPTISTLLTLLLITALAITAIHPAAAAGPTSTGVSVAPAEINITKATNTLNTAIAEGNWPRATAYAELITINDENAPATVWCKWGYALRKMGRYDDAVEKVTTAIEKDPNNAMSYINRGYASLALGEYRNARLDAEEALRLERESTTGTTTGTTTTTTPATSTDCAAAGDDTAASAYNIIALGLLGEGDAKNALVAADTALALQPDHAHYLNTKGVIQMELEKYGDAVTTLTRAVELQDDYIAPYPDAPTPEENLATAQRLYDENKAPVGLIIAAAVLILAIGAGAIFLQKRR